MTDAKQQPYDAKLALILRTAAAVFAEKSYHEASIRDISRETGISLSGLYYYVRSKEELLFLIQDRSFSAVLDELAVRLEGVDEPGRKLRILIENHLRFFVANMKEMKVLSHEAETLSGEYRERVDAKKRRYADICTEILRELLPADSRTRVRVATFSLFGMMNWIYNWYRPERDVSVGELAEDMSQLFLNGYLGSTLSEDGAERTPGDITPSVWRH
jgi:AcrR family transcriptional regulator